jgi:hypothetical protein
VAKNEKSNLKLSHSLLHLSSKQAQAFQKIGHLPEKEVEAIPWDKMCIDLNGPYTICRNGQANLICKCVTMIDPATSWFEIHQYDDKPAMTVANIAEDKWFSR